MSQSDPVDQPSHWSPVIIPALITSLLDRNKNTECFNILFLILLLLFHFTSAKRAFETQNYRDPTFPLNLKIWRQ